MHDLVEHGSVVFAIGAAVNVCERNVPGISTDVTALPQSGDGKTRMKTFAYKDF